MRLFVSLSRSSGNEMKGGVSYIKRYPSCNLRRAQTEQGWEGSRELVAGCFFQPGTIAAASTFPRT